MIFLVLNCFLAVFFLFFTNAMDKTLKSGSIAGSDLSVSLLLTTIESIVFSFTLVMHKVWFDALSLQLLKIVFSLDAIFFTMLSFGLIGIAKPIKSKLVKLIKYGLYVFGVYIVYFRFNAIDISLENGVIIASEYLFSGPARTFFPWTWMTVFTTLYRYVLPIVCFIFLVVLREDNGTQLEKYQIMQIGEGFLLMWLINMVIKYVSSVKPAFTLLFFVSYLFLYVVIYIAIRKTSVPSGKAVFVTILKTIVSYIVPGCALALICMTLQPVGKNISPLFLTVYIIVSIVALLFSFWINMLMNSSTRLYTADYEASLEKDLASIEYKNAEMDQVTARMFDIIKKNIESSSMTVYILTGKNELEVAYSSNNMTNKIAINNPMFDHLLNINRSVVIQSQIEKEHDLSPVHDELEEFFAKTKSDGLFILNEGHNIFGLIILGKKTSGDEYKEYDYNVFVKLYSYFFVFGYYMRNISNKDVIAVVNREIRMASQIITSIQENIDRVKNPKIDIGYLMVPAHSIGGEFIDMIRLTATRHLFVVGDLSGKGIAASMNMVILKSIIRSYLAEVHDFKELVVKINVFIRDSLPKGTIFAGLFALVDFETDTMYYINCGIPALMLYTQVYNNVIEIQGSGHVLGFVKDVSSYLSVKTTKLSHGDIILACTDGLVQSHSLRGEQFGKERVQQALLDNSTYPAQRMAQFTFDGLLKFMSKEMEDDVSILVLKYEGLPEEKEEETETEDENQENTEKMKTEDSFVQDENEAPESKNEADSPMQAVADSVPEVNPADFPQNSVSAKDKESEPEKKDDFGLPEGFDMSSLDDLDALMKEAGL